MYQRQGKLESAAALHRQAADIFNTLGNKRHEGSALNGLGLAFLRLNQLDKARHALTAALALMKDYGSAAQPWTAWASLEDVERADGRTEAADETRLQALAPSPKLQIETLPVSNRDPGLLCETISVSRRDLCLVSARRSV